MTAPALKPKRADAFGVEYYNLGAVPVFKTFGLMTMKDEFCGLPMSYSDWAIFLNQEMLAVGLLEGTPPATKEFALTVERKKTRVVVRLDCYHVSNMTYPSWKSWLLVQYDAMRKLQERLKEEK